MRSLVIATLILGPALAGCVDFNNVGGCLGPNTPEKLIRDDLCKDLVIEIDHVAGMAPDAEALDYLRSALAEVLRKDSVRIIIDQTSLQGRDQWSSTQLQNLEADTRDNTNNGRTVFMHMLYVDGQFNEPGREGVVGFARGSHHIVMFKEQILKATRDDPQRLYFPSTTETEFERAVLVHEFGHALGLVNNGIDMVNDHEADSCTIGGEERADDGHSDNEDSVMFCSVHTVSGLTGLFADSAPPSRFDANDKNDICAAGGRCN